MLGIVLFFLAVIGKIVQANAWFVIPDFLIAGLFIVGVIAVAIQFIITFVVIKKLRRDFFNEI